MCPVQRMSNENECLVRESLFEMKFMKSIAHLEVFLKIKLETNVWTLLKETPLTFPFLTNHFVCGKGHLLSYVFTLN